MDAGAVQSFLRPSLFGRGILPVGEAPPLPSPSRGGGGREGRTLCRCGPKLIESAQRFEHMSICLFFTRGGLCWTGGSREDFTGDCAAVGIHTQALPNAEQVLGGLLVIGYYRSEPRNMLHTR